MGKTFKIKKNSTAKVTGIAHNADYIWEAFNSLHENIRKELVDQVCGNIDLQYLKMRQTT